MSEERKSIIAIVSWCLYDWACASFPLIVTTFIFATYFTTEIAENTIIGTYQWANAIALAGIIVALSSPIVGAIADHGGHHKQWLFFFTLFPIISAAMLWFAYPNSHSVYFTLGCVVIGTIGYELTLVFYNVFFHSLAPQSYLGRISGWGLGSGFIGGIFALLIALFVFVKIKIPWLDTQTWEQVRICGPFVALWYGLFAIPLFLFVPPISSPYAQSLPQAVRAGWQKLIFTLKHMHKEKNIFIYLFSHMIYTDGLNTLFAFGGIYAAGTFGLTLEEVLLFGITINITAGVGSIALGWMDDYLGSKQTVIVSLVFMTILGIPLLFIHNKYLFWFIGSFLCVFIGSIQSASRSLMARLIIDKHMCAEMFGLYALSGRITGFIGPWLFGATTIYFGSQRAGLATVLVLFAFGIVLLLPVRVAPS